MKPRIIALLPIITSIFFISTSKTCLAQQTTTNQKNSTKSSQSLNYIAAGATTSGLAVYSKFALSDQFSLRPMLLFDDFDEDFNGIVIVPVTYDFNQLGGGVIPFAGIGGATSTSDFDVGLELTTGVDYQISRRFTLSGLFNVQLFGDNDIDAIFGLGFNF